MHPRVLVVALGSARNPHAARASADHQNGHPEARNRHLVLLPVGSQGEGEPERPSDNPGNPQAMKPGVTIAVAISEQAWEKETCNGKQDTHHGQSSRGNQS